MALTERAEIVGVLDALYAATLTDYAWLLETVLTDREGAATARRHADSHFKIAIG